MTAPHPGPLPYEGRGRLGFVRRAYFFGACQFAGYVT